MKRMDDKAAESTAASERPDSEEAFRVALERAAEFAVRSGMTAEMFSQSAIGAYASKNPAFREQLETIQLAAQLEVLRAQGRLGVA